MHPPIHLSWEPLTLHLRNPFRLSYGVSETRKAFWLRLGHAALPGDDKLAEGWGEAAIPPYYGVSDEAMIARWQNAQAELAAGRSLPAEPAEIADWRGGSNSSPARGLGSSRPPAGQPG